MATLTVRESGGLTGEITVPGDKSLSHRALILGALAEGKTTVEGWLPAGDTLATLHAIESMGVDIHRDGTRLTFDGGGLQQPEKPINCANAGTAIRLLAGVLSGQSFESVLDGSEQLRKRPMKRIVDPLQMMGANITAIDGKAPLTIKPAPLHGIQYEMPMASAQVKSAILLAGLYADGETSVIEPGPARDHTERMLRAMGVDVWAHGNQISVAKADKLHSLNLKIPGDISSVAFILVAGSIVSDSDIIIRNVGLNPTRTGILDVLSQMGANIEILDQHEENGEPVGDLQVKSSGLKGVTMSGDLIVRSIDELPVLALSATQAEGETHIKDAEELRHKEVDRISLLIQELCKLGAEIEETPDGMIINGPTKLSGSEVSSHGDHRMGMALAIAGLVAEGTMQVDESECIPDSFPGFEELFVSLGADFS